MTVHHICCERWRVKSDRQQGYSENTHFTDNIRIIGKELDNGLRGSLEQCLYTEVEMREMEVGLCVSERATHTEERITECNMD